MLIVQKFGGSSLADSNKIINVAKRIIDTADKGNKVVVVLSAQGDTTDDLLGKIAEITNKPSKREVDMLLSTGEQQSIALMTMAIQSLGHTAVSLVASQFGMYTTSNHCDARIKKVSPERISQELESNKIVIVAGFQGYNRKGDITTLGRGGSDTTAVALAATLHADLCEIYTDVEGVFTADPRIVKNAIKLNEISYDEMLELASLGAQILHNRAVELAKKYHVNLVVRSSLTNNEGTIVKEVSQMEKMLISGLAVDKNMSRISIMGISNEPGKAFRVFSLLAHRKISVDVILQNINRDGLKDITFTVHKPDLEETLEILEKNINSIGYKVLTHDEDISKLSIVGAGMATNPGVASTMFEALYDAGINIQMISTSDIKISVLIPSKDLERAANFVHDRFIDEKFSFKL